jgi:hypothetical protein
MPKESSPSLCRIRLIQSVQFPENGLPPVGCTRRSHLEFFSSCVVSTQTGGKP